LGTHQLLADPIIDHHVPWLGQCIHARQWHFFASSTIFINSKLFTSFFFLIKVALASNLAAWTLSRSSANFSF
jgi:hypothetical protein